MLPLTAGTTLMPVRPAGSVRPKAVATWVLVSATLAAVGLAPIFTTATVVSGLMLSVMLVAPAVSSPAAMRTVLRSLPVPKASSR